MKKTKLLNSLTIAATALAACSATIAIASCAPSTKGDDQKPQDPVVTHKLNTTAAPVDVDLNSIAYPATAKNTSNSTVTINFSAPTTTKVTGFKYRIGYGESWIKEVDLSATTTAQIELPAGSSIQFFAYSTTQGTLSNDKENYNIQFVSSTEEEAGIVLGGNVMSLLCIDNKYDTCLEQLTSNSAYCFNRLFAGSDAIASISDCFLPATTLASNCYTNMFNACKNLQTVCALPATTLKENCYIAMFKGCSRLAVAPHLPAIKLAQGCYVSLFDGCTDLTSISLGYVGNFISKYFQGWTNNVVKQGNIYYNGSDTDKSTSEIPNNFTTVKDPYFEEHKEDLGYKEFTLVPLSGRAKFKNTKSKVTWYCPATTTDTMNTIINDGQLMPVAIDTQDKDISYYDGTKPDNPQLAESLTLDKWPTRSIFSFGFNPVIDNKATNIYSTTSKFTISLASKASGFTKLQYKKVDDVEWTDVNFPLTCEAKTNYVFRGNIGLGSSSKYTNLKITGSNVHIEGNLMYLLTDTTEPATSLPAWAFNKLFLNSTGITSVSENLLPATTLSEGCYASMFTGCTNLTNAPKLKASTLKTDCYNGMFYRCSKLANVDENIMSNATTVAERSCQGMFDSSGIKTTIKLPASTMQTDCYKYMFKNCHALVQAPDLPAGTLASACYMEMFNGCDGMTSTMSDLPATNIPGNAYRSMFQNCTQITATPTFNGVTTAKQAKLTLKDNACQSMFENCSSLINAKPLPLKSIDNATYCCNKMYKGCSSLEIAPCVSFCSGSMAATPESSYEEMFANCKKLIVEHRSWTKYAWTSPSDGDIQNPTGFFFSTCAWASSNMSTWNNMFSGCENRDSGSPTSPEGWRNWKGTGYWDAFYSWRRALTGLSMKSSTTTLVVGQSQLLQVTATPYGAKTNLTWTSNHPEWVSVNTSGWITAKVANKTATITVKDTTTGKTATCTVTTQEAAAAVQISGPTSVTKGSTTTYKLVKKSGGEEVAADFYLDTTYDQISMTTAGKLTVGSTADATSIKIIAKQDGKQVATLTVNITSSALDKTVKAYNASTTEACTITIDSYAGQNIQYSTDGSQWTTWSTGTISVAPQSNIYFRGNNSSGWNKGVDQHTSIIFTDGEISLGGNVMGLLDEGAGTITDIPCQYCFQQLFLGSYGLKSVSKNFLPSTALNDYCYYSMFNSCSNLQSAPDLPATTVPQYAYSHMLQGTGITKAPVISGQKLGNSCYANMFEGCNSLTEAPELVEATSLSDSSYERMFYDCKYLTKGPSKIILNSVPEGVCQHMFRGCERLTTPPVITINADSTGNDCFKWMFYDCKALDITTDSTGATFFFNFDFNVKSMELYCDNMFTYTKNKPTTVWTPAEETPYYFIPA